MNFGKRVSSEEVECSGFVGVNEIPKEAIIFDKTQVGYVDALMANILLNDVKGQLLNIIEGIGLLDRQETAIKRMVTNCLHETVHHVQECMALVGKSEPLKLTVGTDLITMNSSGVRIKNAELVEPRNLVKELKPLSGE
jgi:hypothetical protein